MLSYICLIQLNTCVKYCTKDQRNAMSKMSEIHCTDFNALNAMYVGDVRDGVCGFYATLYAEYRQISYRRRRRYSILCIQWPLTPPGGKARCSCTVCDVGLAVHHHAVQGGSFVLKCSGTCQTTRVIAGNSSLM